MKFLKNTEISNLIENLSGGSQVVPCGQMDDRHDEAGSRFFVILQMH